MAQTTLTSTTAARLVALLEIIEAQMKDAPTPPNCTSHMLGSGSPRWSGGRTGQTKKPARAWPVLVIRGPLQNTQAMNDSVIVALRALLVTIFLGALLGQSVIVPTYASESAAAFPEVGFLAAPYTLVVIAGIACLQLALVAIWVLLSMVQRDVIFTRQALRWVDAVIFSGAAATLLALSLGMHLLGVMRIGGPGVLFAVGGATVCGTAFVLLMLVMRNLLRGATVMEKELVGLYSADPCRQ